MNNPGVRNGIYMGAALIALNLVMYLFDPEFLITYGGWSSFLVYILFMVKAGKEEREILGGYANFGQMLKAVFLSVVIGALIASIFSYILYNFIDPSLLDLVMEKTLEAFDKMEGFLGEEAVELAKEEIEEKGMSMGIKEILMGYGSQLLFGFIPTLIIAAVLKKEKPLMV